jgi:hypothetical protein
MSAKRPVRLASDRHIVQAGQETVTEWWESEPSHQMGMEIAADVTSKTGRYRSLMEQLRCRNCTSKGKTARMILALYAGQDGSVWLWTAGYRGLVNHPGKKDQEVRAERIPPSARPFVSGLFGVAVCSTCRHGQPFVAEPGGVKINFDPAPPTLGRVREG